MTTTKLRIFRYNGGPRILRAEGQGCKLYINQFLGHCHLSPKVIFQCCSVNHTCLCFVLFCRITVSQNLAFLGLSYSSPILVCAMGLMLPTFSFLLSIILRLIYLMLFLNYSLIFYMNFHQYYCLTQIKCFRRTKTDWRSSSFQAKVTGTIISIMGAVVVELYKGPYIRTSSVSSTSSSYLGLFEKAVQYFVFSSSATEHWVLGGILLAGASISVSVWNIIQVIQLNFK